jgi:hypothetical protein
MCSSRCSATPGWLGRHRAASSEARRKATSLLGAANTPRRPSESSLRLFVAHRPEKVPRVVDLTPLVGGALEVAGYGSLQASVVV